MTPISIKFKASALIDALNVMSIVDARSLTPQQGSGAYLFKCNTNNSKEHPEKDGKPWCWVYSRSNDQVARADFELDSLEGEGLFTMPSNPVRMFNNIPLDDVTIDAKMESQADGLAFTVTVLTSSGLKYTHTTFDPRLIATCDKDFESSREGPSRTYNVGLLREALGMARPFLPGSDKKDNVEEYLNTVQIFDKSIEAAAKGNGYMFCSDSTRAFFFQTESFLDNGLTVPSKHIGKIVDFLGKCSGNVAIYRGANQTFAVNEKGQMIGWTHVQKMHTRFAYLGLDRDKFIFRIPKVTILNALETTKAVIDPKQDRIRLLYDHSSRSLKFTSADSAGKYESFPVTVTHKDTEPSLEENFDYLVNLDHFKSLFDDAKGNEVEFRITPIPPDSSRPRGSAMIRTFDEITLDSDGKVTMGGAAASATENVNVRPKDSFTCKATRFMTSLA